MFIYRRKLLQRHRHWKSKQKHLVRIAPTTIIDLIRHPSTKAELGFLSRGPLYIRANQSALRRRSQREKQVDKEVNDILTKIKRTMCDPSRQESSIRQNAAVSKVYLAQLQTYLLRRYMTPLSLRDHRRARRELKLIKSIRRKLRKSKLILRETDKSGVFHIGCARDYEEKAIDYRQKTGAYEELTSNPLSVIVDQVIQLLNKLQAEKKVSVSQHNKLMPKKEKIELAYLYFLPKSHKKETPLRPIINTIHAATTSISKYLDQSIQPLFVRSTTIIDSVNLLLQLHQYIAKGYFTSSTLFVTFDITNLCTMLPQEESLAILAEFLQVHHCERINGMSIDTIIQLARIVL
ncbi:unnamed protein product [Rotaria sordida]|uniref:Uncharacterized protein n=1 Tax=Rotaria sordida TaxID=392033 RepID=A0A819IKW4_9BILA|nr:unnamed protein product [Rotaria sordida]CAF1240010.1 unnamed protein product [Rotaria sordida]CAF1268898.1 unnamed protein product [Rotaria sordida]CAF1522476.1 unnamed protein product [Rotaria sordida]CAF3916251.1 unnamed protein product [Rotaria sordida]